MTGSGAGAADLFAGVPDLERQNGEPVDHQAGRFRIERRVLLRQAALFKPCQQRAVELFCQIVTKLIRTVHAALYFGQFGVGCAWCARFVLDVPQVEVGAMLASDRSEPFASVWSAAIGIRVPEPGESIVKLSDFFR